VGSTFFSDLYTEAEQGAVKLAVPKGEYDFEVEDARPYAPSSMAFLTLKVLSGPQTGKLSEVNCVFPKEDAKRGARFYFINRVQGFLAYPDVKAAFQAADNAPEFADGLQLICDVLKSKRVRGEVNLREDGNFAGSNELVWTKPPSGMGQQQVPTPAAAAATPGPAPAAAPVAATAQFPDPNTSTTGSFPLPSAVGAGQQVDPF